MVTSIEFVIAFSECKGSSAQPEVLKPHRLQAIRVCLCKCKRDAKGKLDKSSTYEANFGAICKYLQEIIPISRHGGFVTSGPKATLIDDNQLIVKDKTHFLVKATDLWGSKPMVHRLHIFLASRGSQGSC
jgi:hypothetical protein